MSASDTNKSTLLRRPSFFGIKLYLAYFGLCFPFTWIFGIQVIIPSEVNYAIRDILYIGVTISCLFFAVIAQRQKTNVASKKSLRVILALSMTFVSLSLIIPNPLLNNPLLVKAIGLLAGMSVGWQYMLWGSFYAKLDIKPAIAILFGTVIASAVIKTLVVALHPNILNSIVYSCFPVVSVFCWHFASKKAPIAEFVSKRYDAQAMPSLRSTGLGVVAFSFAVGLLLSFGFGLFALDIPNLLIAQSLTVAVCIPFMVIAYYRQEDFDFVGLWFVVLLVIAAGIIFVGFPIMGAENVSLAIFTAASMFVVAFLWLALSDIAHNSSYRSDVVFGFGWSLYSLPTALGIASGHALYGRIDHLQFALVIQFILIPVLYLIMRNKIPHDLKLFSDLNPPFSNDRLAQQTRQVDKLSKLYGITEREKEIIILYAQGRSRGFISTKLFISENTVRDHIKKIYKKLHVHNKQDMIDIIEKLS